MRKPILSILLIPLILSIPLRAQTNQYAFTPVDIAAKAFREKADLAAKAARQQAELEARAARRKFIKENHPLRVIDGKLYDFTALMVAEDPIDFSTWTVRGKVLQVLSDGLLIKRSDDVVHLRHWDDQFAATDGAPVFSGAIITGRYRYTSVAGSVSTVIDYDCGSCWDFKEKFATKILIKKWSTQSEVPVSETDLP